VRADILLHLVMLIISEREKNNKPAGVMIKSLIPLFLVFMAVLLATALFEEKNGKSLTELDEIKTSLNSLRESLPHGSLVGCVSKASQPEVVYWTANALAPLVYVVPNAATMDTVLFVFNSSVTDSVVSATINANKLVWKERSDRFYFLLTSKTQ
jgi:hypothetical protein